MILVFDIGNTNIVFGVMEDSKVVKSFRLSSDLGRTVDEFGLDIRLFINYSGIKRSDVKAVIISSVVPQLTSVIHDVVEKYLNMTPIVVGINSNHGLKILIDNPNELGADRLMSAVGSYYMFGKDCITIDFGTATTMEVVTASGEFLGGTIFPGVKLSIKALHSNTAKLPMVDIAKPDNVLGTNTVKSIQSGIFYGYLCMVDGMIKMIKNEVFGDRDDVLILSTGGLGASFSEASSHKMRYEPDLIPFGLYQLYLRTIEK